MMQRLKPYVLPAAIVLGLLFHAWTDALVWLVPYVVFTILLLNFSAVDLMKMRVRGLDVAVMLFQAVGSGAAYMLVKLLGGGEALAQGAMVCVLCPIASSVVVVTSALGVDRRVSTGYTIYGNLLVAVLAPCYFSFIGIHQEMGFLTAALIIFRKTAAVIALPFFVALFMQRFTPGLCQQVSRFKGWALPLWATILCIVLGKTIDYIFLFHEGNERTIIWLGVVAVLLCVLQFRIGRLLGQHWNQPVAGGQLLGQKNTGMGIWMSFMFLTPLASVALAFYAIAQNIFNSWQMWVYQRRHPHATGT